MSTNYSEYGLKFVTAVFSNKKERFSIPVTVNHLKVVDGECNEFYRTLFSVYDSVVFHTNQMARHIKDHSLFQNYKGNLAINVVPSSYRRIVALACTAARTAGVGGSIYDISVLFILTPDENPGIWISVTTMDCHEQMHDERVKIADIILS